MEYSSRESRNLKDEKLHERILPIRFIFLCEGMLQGHCPDHYSKHEKEFTTDIVMKRKRFKMQTMESIFQDKKIDEHESKSYSSKKNLNENYISKLPIDPDISLSLHLPLIPESYAKL